LGAKMPLRREQWLSESVRSLVIQSLMIGAGLLLAPSSVNAQSVGDLLPPTPPIPAIDPAQSVGDLLPPTPPIPAIAPLVDSLDLPDTIVQELNSVCSGSLQSDGCTAALGKTLSAALENLPPEALGNVLSELTAPVISELDLPGDVAAVVGRTCTSLPPSPECVNLLNGLALQGPVTQQVVSNAAAFSTLQTSRQITDFALSDAVVDGLIPASDSAAVLRTVTPSVMSFGISGVSHTSHDGFEVESPRVATGRTPEFDSLDAGITLGMRFDASKTLNLPADSLTIGLFGNYTNSDIDLDSSAVLRKFGFRNAGDASLNSGSGGGYSLLTNGRVYGLALASGEFGSASVDDAILNSHSDFDTTGFASSAIGGVVLPAGPATKLDLRAGVNYLTTRADNHIDSAQIHYRDGRVDESSGTLSVRLFTAWNRGQTVLRPFVQGGLDYRFHYQNEVKVENVKFSFDEGRTTLFGRVGMDFDIGDRFQAYVAFRTDHNEDFDTVAGQAGLTVKLN
jgi:Autotransporter beta-domain